MNILITSILLISINLSLLDYARTIEFKMREKILKEDVQIIDEKEIIKEDVQIIDEKEILKEDVQIIDEKEIIKEEPIIINEPEKEILAELIISVVDNNSKVVTMTFSEAKDFLYYAHREIMKEELKRVTKE